jgi:O-antigen ligase
MLGLAQFLQRRQEALEQNADNYGFFVDGRITGFAGHWMTFGGEQMIVFLMLASFLLFSGSRTWKLLFWPLLLLMWAAITLGMTRCIFLLGLPAGMIYLLWRLRPAYAMALPLVAAVGLAAAPATVHERIVSAFKPHGDVDSNAHRAVCRATGWEMVKAHPWLGLGPEQVGKQFDRYVPARINRPLPHGWYGHLHNIYLQYAAERGIPALVCFLWLIGKSMLDFLRRLSCSSTTREARFVLHGAVAVIIAVLAEGIFEYNLGDSEVLTLFLSAIACGYVAIERDNTTPEAARESAAEPVEDALPCVPSIGA